MRRQCNEQRNMKTDFAYPAVSLMHFLSASWDEQMVKTSSRARTWLIIIIPFHPVHLISLAYKATKPRV